MKRKVEYIFAGNNGKPVYVQGYLTNESGSVKLQVVSTNPEPRPAPGLYEAGNLPGGWIRLLPDGDASVEGDGVVMASALKAGFHFKPSV